MNATESSKIARTHNGTRATTRLCPAGDSLPVPSPVDYLEPARQGLAHVRHVARWQGAGSLTVATGAGLCLGLVSAAIYESVRLGEAARHGDDLATAIDRTAAIVIAALPAAGWCLGTAVGLCLKYGDASRAEPLARLRRLIHQLTERAQHGQLSHDEADLLRAARRVATGGGWTPGTDTVAVALGTASGALWGLGSGVAIILVALLCILVCCSDGDAGGGGCDCGPCGDPCCCLVVSDHGVPGHSAGTSGDCCPSIASIASARPPMPAGQWEDLSAAYTDAVVDRWC